LIIGALIVVFAKNPVHNAMGLVMTLISLAIIYITLNATL
jgi:NADH:ubiquinone oxidoreductase subunit 6 (subunit J)